MDISIGSALNTVANIASRRTDSGKGPESALNEFLTTMSRYGL